MELRDIMTIATIVFAAGVLYGKLEAFRRDFDAHRTESLSWRAKLEATLFGADGRNGLVGDTIKHGEHIKHCIFLTRNGERDNG
jgi:hypothetical protein